MAVLRGLLTMWWRLRVAAGVLRREPGLALLRMLGGAAIVPAPWTLLLAFGARRGLLGAVRWYGTGLGAAVLALVLAASVIRWIQRSSDRVAAALRCRNAFLHGFETERLAVRVPRSTDAAALDAQLDDLVLANNGWTQRIRRGYLRTIRHDLRLPGDGRLVVTERAGDAVVGDVCVFRVDRRNSACVIGWWIGADHRRKGYGGEVVRGFLELLHQAGFAEVAIGTAETNLPVQRICAAVGATVTDRRDYPLPDGRTIPTIWYVHRAHMA